MFDILNKQYTDIRHIQSMVRIYVIIPAKSITHGEELFYLRGIMWYGLYLGDGSERDVDYTAVSLHQMAVAMNKYYEQKTVIIFNDEWDVVIDYKKME